MGACTEPTGLQGTYPVPTGAWGGGLRTGQGTGCEVLGTRSSGLGVTHRCCRPRAKLARARCSVLGRLGCSPWQQRTRPWQGQRRRRSGDGQEGCHGPVVSKHTASCFHLCVCKDTTHTYNPAVYFTLDEDVLYLLHILTLLHS